LQLEVNQIKSEIKILKEENQELKQDFNLLKIEHKLKSAASIPNDSETEPEPKDTPPFDRNQQHNLEILGTFGVGLSQGFHRETYQQIELLC
jgi:hypothetical protein